jgi:Protein of unknown function (DUF3240)
MTAATEGLAAISISVPPALEDSVVDWLLERDSESGFTAYHAYGHGSSHEHLTISEQVRGRQRRTIFRVVVTLPELDGLLAKLESDFGGADLYYYAVPILRSGHLGASG